MDVNKAELRRIADEADASRKSAQQQKKREARSKATAERQAANDKADQILASIPAALNEAAPHARHVAGTKARVVVAQIAIVNERLSSIMDSRGWLDEEDERILKAVRKKFKGLSISGVELKLKTYSRQGSFGSADGLDSAEGPCTYYYIEAKTQI